MGAIENVQDTYLDPEAMLKRIKDMEDQAQKVYSQISKTQTVMEDLKESFEGTSAMRLQAKYTALSETFSDLLKYLHQKAEDMQTLTGNVEAADEE